MRARHLDLIVPLIASVLLGIAYVFFAPPWQHYDEPGHFEYAWLIAHRGQLPLPGDVDVAGRIQIFESMARHNFFDGPAPALPAAGQAPEIGITQLGDSPLYYLIASIGIVLVRNASIETQLYAARLISVLLYAMTVFFAWLTAERLTQPRHPLRWLVPALVGALPAVADLMSAVNNDALAVAAFSAFTAFSVRWLRPRDGIRSGFHWGNAVVLVLAALFCYLTKSTALLAVPAALLVLMAGLFDRRGRLIMGSALALSTVAAVLLTVQRQDAHAWYRSFASQDAKPTRCAKDCGEAPHGMHVIRVGSQSGATTAPYLFQPLTSDTAQALAGKTVTISAWMWTNSASSISLRAPTLFVDYTAAGEAQFSLSAKPAFVSYTIAVPDTVTYARLTLDGVPGADVYYDNISVTVHKRARGTSDLNTPAHNQVNAVRNASGETEALTLPAPVFARLTAASPEWYNWPLTISALQDPVGSDWYYQLAAERMFESLWVRFAWGHIVLSSGWILFCAALTVIGLTGTLLLLWHRRHSAPWAVCVFLTLCAAGAVAQTLPRGNYVSFEAWMWLPSIRYALPTVIALSLPIAGGWSMLAKRVPRNAGMLVFYGLFGVLNAVSLLHVARLWP
jgi:hypothetical protein